MLVDMLVDRVWRFVYKCIWVQGRKAGPQAGMAHHWRTRLLYLCVHRYGRLWIAQDWSLEICRRGDC